MSSHDPSIAVLNDDPLLAQAIAKRLASAGFSCEAFTKLPALLNFLEQTANKHRSLHVLLDWRLNEGEGEDGSTAVARIIDAGRSPHDIFLLSGLDLAILESLSHRLGLGGAFLLPQNETAWKAFVARLALETKKSPGHKSGAAHSH